MQEVFDWLLTNWRIVLEVVLLVFSVVILIVKKKPVNSILCDILQASMLGILDAECSGITNGAAKKLRCVNFVINYLHNKYPGLDTDRYRELISLCIENILTTPQKKGE